MMEITIMSIERKLVPFYILLFTVLIAFTAHAQEEMFGGVGNGSPVNPGALLTVDQANGAGTLVGDTITPGGLTGIAFNSSGELFGSTIFGPGTTSTLVQLDPDTGVVIANFGPITDPTLGGAAISIGDLAFDPATDTLYGIQSNADLFLFGGSLLTIDTSTAVATFLGFTGVLTGGGLAFGPDGTLFFASSGVGVIGLGIGTLHTLNPNTGAVLSSVILSSGNFYDGLGVRNDGTLFATPGNFMGMGDQIWTIDSGTGIDTFVGNTGTGSTSDLDFLREINVSIEKTSTTSSVTRNKGTQITYTINIESDGVSNAFDVTVTDTLPDGSVLVNASPECEEFVFGGGEIKIVECDVGMLPVGDDRELTITINITPEGDSILNEALVEFLGGQNSGSFTIKVKSGGGGGGCTLAAASTIGYDKALASIFILLIPAFVVLFRIIRREKKT